jgi:hypothetical protein
MAFWPEGRLKNSDRIVDRYHSIEEPAAYRCRTPTLKLGNSEAACPVVRLISTPKAGHRWEEQNEKTIHYNRGIDAGIFHNPKPD